MELWVIEMVSEIAVGTPLLPSAALSGFLRIHSVPCSQEFHFLLKSLTTQTFTESHGGLCLCPKLCHAHCFTLGCNQKAFVYPGKHTRLPPALLTLPVFPPGILFGPCMSGSLASFKFSLMSSLKVPFLEGASLNFSVIWSRFQFPCLWNFPFL